MCMLIGSDLASGQRWRRGLAVRCKPHGVIRRASLPAYFLAPPTKGSRHVGDGIAAHRALLTPSRKVGYRPVKSQSWLRVSKEETDGEDTRLRRGTVRGDMPMQIGPRLEPYNYDTAIGLTSLMTSKRAIPVRHPPKTRAGRLLWRSPHSPESPNHGREEKIPYRRARH